MKKKIKYLMIIFVLVGLYMPMIANAAYKKVTCGNASQGLTKTPFPKRFPYLTSTAVSILEVAVPIIIIIFGMIDLIKAITSGKEDEMKKAQSTLIKRIITGAIVFFVFVGTKLLINIVVGDGESAKGIIDCVNCFINYKCEAA